MLWGPDDRDMEKAELLNAFFISIFTDKIGFQESWAPETGEKEGRGKRKSKEDIPLLEEDQATECLKLDIHKSVGPSEMLP